MNNKEDIISRKAGRENHFRVPEGYFENFTERMMAQLPNSQADSNAEDMTTTLTHRAARKTTTVRKLWKRVAVVAACVAVIGIGTTAYLAQQDNKPAADEMANTSTTEEQYYDDYVDEVADFAMLDNTDIIACMSEE
ncbi:MAG: hypothetical protein MSH57_08085 [Prevotella sp.]|nr:hypothetical protein [Prevotella sp.]